MAAPTTRSVPKRRVPGSVLPFVSSFAAALACLVPGALAIFQGFLVSGAPLGRFAWGGRHRLLPVSLRAGSAASIVIYALLATVVLARADVVQPGLSDGRCAEAPRSDFVSLGTGWRTARANGATRPTSRVR
jgi:hypothetical protein